MLLLLCARIAGPGKNIVLHSRESQRTRPRFCAGVTGRVRPIHIPLAPDPARRPSPRRARPRTRARGLSRARSIQGHSVGGFRPVRRLDPCLRGTLPAIGLDQRFDRQPEQDGHPDGGDQGQQNGHAPSIRSVTAGRPRRLPPRFPGPPGRRASEPGCGCRASERRHGHGPPAAAASDPPRHHPEPRGCRQGARPAGRSDQRSADEAEHPPQSWRPIIPASPAGRGSSPGFPAR